MIAIKPKFTKFSHIKDPSVRASEEVCWVTINTQLAKWEEKRKKILLQFLM